jgi:phage gp36-like protein
MAYIDRTDLETYMEAIEIDQIIDGDPTIVDSVIADSEEFCAEKLRQRFDTVAEYAKIGVDRNRQLLKAVVSVSLFYLSERLVTNNIPENRFLAYDRAVEWLEEVASGKRMTDLDPIDADSKTGWNIRWGSKTKSKDNFY